MSINLLNKFVRIYLKKGISSLWCQYSVVPLSMPKSTGPPECSVSIISPLGRTDVVRRRPQRERPRLRADLYPYRDRQISYHLHGLGGSRKLLPAHRA
ncbi:MAG: hypothetical protein PHQ34_01805 [Methanothrix sp.]|nr:hypothetical protein [Methanothrix sp.]